MAPADAISSSRGAIADTQITGVVRSLEEARRRGRRRLRSEEVISVQVVAEHAIPRAGLRALLEHDLGIAVTSEASSVGEAAALARSSVPDVTLLDAGCLQPEAGLLTRTPGRRVAVLVLLDSELDHRLVDALRGCAAGVLSKDAHPGELVRAIRIVAQGGACVPPRITRRLIDELHDTTWAPAPAG